MNDAAQPLAQGFSHHMMRWAARQGCDESTIQALYAVATEVARATAEGHVCVSIDAQLRPCLLSSGLVGTPDAPGAMPLILDAGGRLYLHRYFDDERRLALRLVHAATAPGVPAGAAASAMLDELFAANESRLAGAADQQKLAAQLALEKRLVIISGGPGTGKTSTVVNLLAGLLTQYPAFRIALAAPTGKARARLLEAIRQRAAGLPESIRSRLPDDASTIHRLLGVRPDGSFTHHAGNLLAIDALVVDEASMVDLALARRLLEAVPDHAHIILLGDKDQLASVESGAVFAEISFRQGALHDSVVWFIDNYRFAADSGPGRLAADISRARAESALEWLRRGEEPSVTWLNDAGRGLAPDSIQYLAAGFEPYFDALKRSPRDRAGISAAFSAFRVLCAMRDGVRGVDRINELVDARAQEKLASLIEQYPATSASPWYPGRPVLVMRNDYVLNLMNGDIGITLPDEDGELKVFFADDAGGFRAIAPSRMPSHDTAYATTVHKAQGSEFDEVMLVLPDKPGPLVTRELLYTAVTRARRRVTLCAGEVVIRAAIDMPTRRFSGLRARLAAPL
jgi:exodeoxyribonuclease V alpha subunit